MENWTLVCREIHMRRRGMSIRPSIHRHDGMGGQLLDPFECLFYLLIQFLKKIRITVKYLKRNK